MTPDTLRAATEAAPKVEDLLVWAVEDGVIRMSQVMSADLQDALVKFAHRIAALSQEPPAAAPAQGEWQIALHEWAVSRWRDEVEHRPLVNVHRRTLDDCWRQVIRYAGGDPDAVVGPSHDTLLSHPPAEGSQTK